MNYTWVCMNILCISIHVYIDSYNTYKCVPTSTCPCEGKKPLKEKNQIFPLATTGWNRRALS